MRTRDGSSGSAATTSTTAGDPPALRGLCGQALSPGRRCSLRCEQPAIWEMTYGGPWPQSLSVMVLWVDRPLALIEFPADDPDRARRFWSDLLGVELAERSEAEGRGWQTHTGDPAVGIHERGTGPGDTVSLPYFTIADMDAALARVKALGGSVIHPGSRWAICRDSEGSPFGLALDAEPF